jgi:hypothetical protein
MRVIVLTGVPGSGKTEYRERELGDLDYVDIKDVYRDHLALGGQSWDGAILDITTKVGKLLMKNWEPVVIEGMFLPGTPSREKLERELRDMQVDVDWVFVHRPYADCLEGIEAGPENDKARRRLILDKYWKRAEAVYDEAG